MYIAYYYHSIISIIIYIYICTIMHIYMYMYIYIYIRIFNHSPSHFPGWQPHFSWHRHWLSLALVRPSAKGSAAPQVGISWTKNWESSMGFQWISWDLYVYMYILMVWIPLYIHIHNYIIYSYQYLIGSLIQWIGLENWNRKTPYFMINTIV